MTRSRAGQQVDDDVEGHNGGAEWSGDDGDDDMSTTHARARVSVVVVSKDAKGCYRRNSSTKT